MEVVHRFAKICCPVCRATVSAAGEVGPDGRPVAGRGPADGDLTLCPNCLEISAFRVNNDGIELAAPTELDTEGMGEEVLSALRSAREVLLATRPHRWLVMLRRTGQDWVIGAVGPIPKGDVEKRVHQIFGQRRASFVVEWCCAPREDQIQGVLDGGGPEDLMGLGSCVQFFSPLYGKVAEG